MWLLSLYEPKPNLGGRVGNARGCLPSRLEPFSPLFIFCQPMNEYEVVQNFDLWKVY